jgi:hypothetical protein
LEPFSKGRVEFEIFKTDVKTLIKNFFADARDPMEDTEWKHVKVECKKLFQTWLVEDDLNFFFNNCIVETEHWIKRRKFWQGYVDDNKINLSWPVLSTHTSGMLTFKERKEHIHGILKRCKQSQSALLFKIGNLVIIEISDSGACFIYPDNHPNVPVFGDLSTYYFLNELRNDGNVETIGSFMLDINYPIKLLKEGHVLRIIHAASWESVISNVILRVTGINAPRKRTGDD